MSLAVSCGPASKAPTPNRGSVRVVSVTPIEPLDDPANAPAETVPAVAAPEPTTREALERAIAWATEAMRHYRGDGDREEVRRHLGDARIALLDADLPDVMQERGLSVINLALPEDLRGPDLETLYQELEAEVTDVPEDAYIAQQARRILARFGAVEPPAAQLAIFVEEVQRYVRYYRGTQREFFERSFARKHKYWPTIQATFGPRRIPLELGYMALVESGFQPRARSHADAHGLWQFIPGTGKRYGLIEREDFYDVAASTEAAAEYLLDLIGIFGRDGFLLATAAYNAGEGRIQGCLRHLDDPFGGRSFWAIRGCLARETREYVPRILAAAIIATDPQRFGFDLESSDAVLARYDIVTVPRPTRLSTLAARGGTTVEALRAANEELGSLQSTPVRNFPLYVPKGTGPVLTAALAAGDVPTERVPTLASTAPRGDRGTITYTVRSGDTLSEIAERFGISYSKLAAANSLRSPYNLRVGQRLRVDASAGAARTVHYRVKRGNSLAAIADIFGVSERDIRSWNNLSSSRLRAGEELLIHPARAIHATRYRVRHGDSVDRIARRHGVATTAVLTTNGLGSRSVIRPGQELIVYVPERNVGAAR